MTNLSEPSPSPALTCPLCAPHKWHGLPCTVGIGQRTVWGAPAEVKTCECQGVWVEGGAA